jgi:hypothetical protein
MIEFNQRHWRLIFDAVRKDQQRQVVGSKFYEEYSDILNSIYFLAYPKTNK